MDVKIQNGDMVLDSTGNPVCIDGMEEILQRVRICITAKKNGFIYNKEFGRVAETDATTERGVRNLEAQLREAIISLEGVELFLLQADTLTDGRNRLHIDVTYNNEKARITEVV